jgi:predicted N-formylglutamate amidohydrolase
MARVLAQAFGAPLVSSTVSRLLVDLNRSIGHPQLFSVATRGASGQIRSGIIEQYYLPFRAQVEQRVTQALLQHRRLIHVSSHSFTPRLNGKVRNADVGLLYHPGRPGEAELCARWKAALGSMAPALRVRRNYPYAGKGDGLTSYLRSRFSPDAYVGIELEVNQGITIPGGRRWAALRVLLIDSLRKACAGDAATVSGLPMQHGNIFVRQPAQPAGHGPKWRS